MVHVVVVDQICSRCWEEVCRGTYSFMSLEGVGLLVFSTFESLSAVNASIHTAHLLNTEAIIRTITGSHSAAFAQVV